MRHGIVLAMQVAHRCRQTAPGKPTGRGVTRTCAETAPRPRASPCTKAQAVRRPQAAVPEIGKGACSAILSDAAVGRVVTTTECYTLLEDLHESPGGARAPSSSAREWQRRACSAMLSDAAGGRVVTATECYSLLEDLVVVAGRWRGAKRPLSCSR